MDNGRLSSMKMDIERMNKFHQIEVLRMLHQDKSITLNENKNGVFINLSEVTEAKIRELDAYIRYVSVQETQLNQVETIKEEFKSAFYGLGPDTVGNRKHITRITKQPSDDHTKDKENKDKEKKGRNTKV